MQDALVCVLRTLADLYLITFILRLIFQWNRTDARNPLVQFILRVTNPLVIPARRIIPPVGSFDTGTAVVLLLLAVARTMAVTSLSCVGDPGPLQFLFIATVRVAELTLHLYFWVVLLYVLMSWINPGTWNPASALLASVAEPLLAPLRRFIPSIGGLDLSPLFVVIGLQALVMMLPMRAAMSGLICTGPL